MLRIVKLKSQPEKPDKPVKPIPKIQHTTKPYVESWIVSYHLNDSHDTIEGDFGSEDIIGTIQVTQLRWKKIPLPKNETLHTPTKLCKWFHKVFDKKIGLSDSKFYYTDSHNTYFHISKDSDWSIIALKQNNFIHNVYFIPLFTKTLIDIDATNLSHLPEPLKIDIRQTYSRLLS